MCRSSTKNRKMRPDASFTGLLGGRMIPSGGGGGGGASKFVTRPPVTTVIDVMSCLTPSSKISNSSFLRSGTKLPFSSRTITSFVTRSMRTVKVGFCGWAGLAGAGGLLRPVHSAPLAPALDVCGGRRNRRGLDLRPIESHARILCFDPAPHLRVERRPADFDARRGTEPVENPRWPFAAPVRDRLDKIEILVAAPVARDRED